MGILFYIGTTLAAAMYIVGAIEILIVIFHLVSVSEKCVGLNVLYKLQTYIAPSLSIFGDTTIPENMYNNYRVFGTCLLAIIGLIVYVGVKFVNK